MRVDRAPRVDRWLVLPESLFQSLAGRAQVRGMLAMRLASRHVESVSVEHVAEHTRALLGEGWAHVRLVIGEGSDAWHAALDEQLCLLADDLAPQDGARVLLHEFASEPQRCLDTLHAPDEAVLQRWLEQGRPEQPAVDAADTQAGWVERYRQAFGEWRQAVDVAYGPGAFDWFHEAADDGASNAVQALSGRFHDFASNDDFFQRRVGGRWRGRDDGEDAPALELIGRWKEAVDGVSWTIEAHARPEHGADVTLTIHRDAAGAAAPPMPVAVQVLDPGGATLARDDVQWLAGAGRALVVLANPENVLRRVIRRGQARLRLYFVPAADPPA